MTRYILALCLAAPLSAQSPTRAARPAPRLRLDAAARRDVVDTVAALFDRVYVDADTGRMIGDRIRRRVRSGAYDRLIDPREFSSAVTTDLRAVNGDLHLDLDYAPGEGEARSGPAGLPMPGGPGDTMPDPPGLARMFRRANYGFARLEILPGNVGYLDLTGFGGGPEGFRAATAAVRFLEHTDAIIIDLRRNGGGSGDLSNFLISHFTGPDSVRSLRITNRSARASSDRWTLARVPGPRRSEVPLYLLVSRGTASAGEDFAFVLQNLHRATLVGERTAGAGHNNAFVDAGHGFALSISFTRVSDPRTGKEWERVGVQPDVRTEPDSALAVAHLDALAKLVARAGDPMTRRLAELAREYAAASYHPRRVPAAVLARYTGRYEGGREVTRSGGRLRFRAQPGLPSEELVPISDTVFAPGPAVRVAFLGGAGEPALRLIFPDGGGPTLRREPAR